MGLRMRKSIKIAPGINLNIGKNGVGISVGTKGLRYSINSNGRRTTTVGIPGTGISYSTSSKSRGYSEAKKQTAQLEKEKTRADKERQKQIELEYARAVVDEYEKKMEAIISIHKECQMPINWREIYNKPEPFSKENQGNFDADKCKEWEDLHKVSEKVLSKDIDLMLEVIEELNPFEGLVDFGSGFEVGFIDDRTVEVEFDIKSDDVVPFESQSLTSTGKLSTKPLTKSKRLDILQDYVCSCSLKIARELFAILPLKVVIVHAKDTFLDTQVGNNEVKDILSVKFDRPTLYRLDFDLIDPSDSMSNFTHNMNFKKTQGFKPIERVI